MLSVFSGRNVVRLCGFVMCALLLMPVWAFAQAADFDASLSGVVTDASGGVLPGVTVEASSPVLIEKMRSTVTDERGQYRIIQLKPGTYDVTFTLPGFSVVKREGLELTAAFSARLSAELSLGTLEETIVVTGETPLVDVQNIRQTQVVGSDEITSLPIGRTATDMAGILVPAMGTNLSAYGAGGGPETGRLMVDGVGIGSGTSGTSQYRTDVIQAAEVVISSFGNLGEAEVGSPIVNIVPKTGGNTFAGSFFSTGAGASMASSNSDDLVAAGIIQAPDELIKRTELNLGIGGPIVRDRLWFFFTTRHQTDDAYVVNLFANKNAGNPNAWTYEPDLAHRATNDNWYFNTSLRLTWQIFKNQKLNIFWDEQKKCETCGIYSSSSPTTSPEANDAGYITGKGQHWRVQQLVWTAPLTNQILAEFGIGHPNSLYGRYPPPGGRDLTPMTEQGGIIPGLNYRNLSYTRNRGGLARWRGSVSYVTGAHNLKFGFDGQRFNQVRDYTGQKDGLVNFRVNNGVPNRLTLAFNRWRYHLRVPTSAFYAQNSSTFGRLTLHGGLRFDTAHSYSPEQKLYAQFGNPVEILFPETEIVKSYKDLSPRIGAAYDVKGDGRTSVRMSLGRYLAAVNADGLYAATSPVALIGGGGPRTPPTTTRSWNDSFFPVGDSRRGNFAPDCDLLNPARNNECGAMSVQNFGQLVPSTVDPRLMGYEGSFGVRPYDWGFGLSVQHQLAPRTSIEVAYNRRWWGNFTLVDNRLITPANWDAYSVTAPSDPRLPGGGGYAISDLAEIREAQFGLSDPFTIPAEDIGDQVRYFHAVDVTFRGQVRGVTLRAASTTGREVTDRCDVLVDNPSARDCHTARPFRTRVNGLASYVVPRIGLQVSGSFTSTPGTEILANRVFTTAEVAQSLGRPLAGGNANVTINLLSPGDMYRDRINQLDLRFAKAFAFGTRELTVGADIYNSLNSNTVTNSNNTFGSSWLTPTAVQAARFIQFSGELKF